MIALALAVFLILSPAASLATTEKVGTELMRSEATDSKPKAHAKPHPHRVAEADKELAGEAAPAHPEHHRPKYRRSPEDEAIEEKKRNSPAAEAARRVAKAAKAAKAAKDEPEDQPEEKPEDKQDPEDTGSPISTDDHPEEKLVPGPDNKEGQAAEAAADAAARSAEAKRAESLKKNRVHIQLFYETRCPDCTGFLSETLEPMTLNEDFKDLYNIDLNPYGNAQTVHVDQTSEGYKFWHPDTTKEGWDFVHICQHGPDECFGNLIQACAIEDEPVEKHLQLAFCMAGQGHANWGTEKSSYECMQKIGMNITNIHDCVKSPRGNKLLEEFGKKTRAVQGREGTPWVLVNDKHVPDPSKLLQHVCFIVDPSSDQVSTCKQFHGTPASSDPPENEDIFKVLPELKQVPRDLVSLPPPEHI